MKSDLNRSTFIGRLGADAKQSNENSPVTFSIATTSRWVDEQNNQRTQTDWHNIAVFGALRKYAITFRKGDRVYVEGELRNNEYAKTVGGETINIRTAEIRAREIERLTAKANADDATSFGYGDAKEPEPARTEPEKPEPQAKPKGRK